MHPHERQHTHGGYKAPFCFVRELADIGQIKQQDGNEEQTDDGPRESHVPHAIQFVVLYDGDGRRELSLLHRGRPTLSRGRPALDVDD